MPLNVTESVSSTYVLPALPWFRAMCHFLWRFLVDIALPFVETEASNSSRACLTQLKKQATDWCFLAKRPPVRLARSVIKICQSGVAALGTGDPYFHVKWAHWLEETLPDVREVVIVEGGKVYFPEEYPELVNEKLRAFWTGMESSGVVRKR